MKPEKPLGQLPHHVVLRSGTTLVFGRDGRQVRVLPLPRHCGYHMLHDSWDDCFGTEAKDEVVVWWPWNPTDPPGPSLN